MRTGLVFLAMCICNGALGSDEAATDDDIPTLYAGRDSNSKIVNGKDAPRGKYPSQVMLYRNRFLICGGTLLDAKHVLTAAHCVTDESRAEKYTVAVGKHFVLEDAGSDQIMNVIDLTYHPQYDKFINANDIAILTLEDTVTFNNYVKPVILAEPGDRRKKRCYASGFGLVSQSPRKMSTVLQELKTRIISNKNCKKKAVPYGVADFVTNKVMCTLDRKAGVCSGDSGGPVGCFRGDSYVQYGVLSFGSSDCKEGFNIFTRVSKYQNWINAQLS